MSDCYCDFVSAYMCTACLERENADLKAEVERLNDEVQYLEWLCRGLTIHEGNNRNAFEQYRSRRRCTNEQQRT